MIDAKEAAEQATWPTVVLVASAAVLVASVPVLLIGLAFVLAAAFGISQGAAPPDRRRRRRGRPRPRSRCCRSASSSTASRVFRRSREELQRNIAWIKTVLTPEDARRVRR